MNVTDFIFIATLLSFVRKSDPLASLLVLGPHSYITWGKIIDVVLVCVDKGL